MGAAPGQLIEHVGRLARVLSLDRKRQEPVGLRTTLQRNCSRRCSTSNPVVADIAMRSHHRADAEVPEPVLLVVGVEQLAQTPRGLVVGAGVPPAASWIAVQRAVRACA